MSETQASGKARARCREIMSTDVKTVDRATSIREVASVMRDADVGSLPVVENGKLVGIVTDRDIVVRSLAEDRDPSTSVGYAMTTDVYSVKPDDFVFEAIRLMGDKQVRRIPVVSEDGMLAGIISMADIALEVEDDREIAEALEEISSGSAFWSKK